MRFLPLLFLLAIGVWASATNRSGRRPFPIRWNDCPAEPTGGAGTSDEDYRCLPLRWARQLRTPHWLAFLVGSSSFVGSIRLVTVLGIALLSAEALDNIEQFAPRGGASLRQVGWSRPVD